MDDRMIFHRVYYDTINSLPQHHQLSMYTAIVDYAFDNKLPDFSGIKNKIFLLLKPQIDASRNKTINQLIRSSQEYREWRRNVFRRDNYTCALCKRKGGYLHAHHQARFSEFPELRFDIENGITLCKECHQEIHRTRRAANE